MGTKENTEGMSYNYLDFLIYMIETKITTL
jgi:hypothetical protein